MTTTNTNPKFAGTRQSRDPAKLNAPEISRQIEKAEMQLQKAKLLDRTSDITFWAGRRELLKHELAKRTAVAQMNENGANTHPA